VITSPAAGAVVGDTLWVDYTIGDGVSSWIAWDGAAESPIVGAPPFSFNVAGFTEGAHSVSIRSVDQYGNSTTATRTFTVDHTGPTVAITRPAAGSWVDPAQPLDIEATSDDPGTQSWDIRVDGSMIVGGIGSTLFAYGMPAPTSWTNNSSHTITAQSTDAVGNVGGLATVTVRADTRKPDVTIAAPGGTLSRSGVVTGTASDAGSGVSQVVVDFRRLRPDDSCGAVQFSGTATLAGGSWSLALPGAAVSGAYCLRATATDAVGHTRVAADQPHAVVDITGPVAPVGLAPVGELWVAPTAISWGAVADAVSYNYRVASTQADLDGATVLSTTATSAAVGAGLPETWFWQVQGVDEFGNEGAWTTPQAVTVLGAPTIDGGCSLLCGIVGSTLDLSWSEVPGAVGYRVSVTWRGVPGDPSDNIVERYLLGDATNTTLTLPANLPSGTIVVRVRAELDHKVEGTRLGPWSERVRLLHIASPATPTLLSPAEGSYVEGDGVHLVWSDDSATFAWELRIAPTSALGDDGGLDTDASAPLLDPMVLLLVVGGSSGHIPPGVDLDEVDAVLDCTALEDFAGGGPLPFMCADGSFTIPETLADGDYYWQVRGFGIDDLMGGFERSGGWSSVGHFIVGEAPAPTGPGGGGDGGTSGSHSHPSRGTTVVTSDTSAAPDGTDAETAESPADDESAGSGAPVGGSDDSDDSGTASAESGDGSGDGGFPFGWIFAALGALVVLAGAGAFIRFLVVRGR